MYNRLYDLDVCRNNLGLLYLFGESLYTVLETSVGPK